MQQPGHPLGQRREWHRLGGVSPHLAGTLGLRAPGVAAARRDLWSPRALVVRVMPAAGTRRKGLLRPAEPNLVAGGW